MGETRDLLARLRAGPVFLMLGQGFERVPLAEFGTAQVSAFPSEFSDRDRGVVGSSELAEFAAIAPNKPLDPDLQLVAEFHWSGVFTSRIDSQIIEAFRSSWRRVTPSVTIGTGRFQRSPTDLQVRYLFGGLGLPPDEAPAVTLIDQADWQTHAQETLRNLVANLLTPRGVILVEDWALEDWVSSKDFYQLAGGGRIQPGQLHLFSASKRVASDRFIASAVEKGTIILHENGLAAFLRDAQDAGFIDFEAEPLRSTDRLIPANAGFMRLDISRWNQISGTARPVDVSLLEPFAHSSRGLRFQRFRTFLGASEGAPPWKGIASGLKFERDFESDLIARIRSALDSIDEEGPVILHGQTATGKSLALAWVAQELARSGEAAVLHQSRRRDMPLVDDLEPYAEWVEAESGLKTVLIWDGMAKPEDYHNLQKQLLARGNRILVVGSAYRQSAAQDNQLPPVTAPVEMTSAEIRRLDALLREFGVDQLRPDSRDTSILALLFRLLPETQSGIQLGLARELRAAERGLEEIASARSVLPDARMGALAQALIDAGFQPSQLTPSDHPDSELRELNYRDRSIAEQLSALILTVGRRGLTVPLALALRAVGRESSGIVIDLFKSFDVFRWTEDTEGEQFLGARTTLEAEIAARHDLSQSAEVEVVTSLVRNLNPRPTRSGGDEVQFIVRLFEQVGPQSAETPFRNHYADFAEAFEDLRQGAVNHPRLTLLESNLAREAVKRARMRGTLSADAAMASLRDVEELLTRALADDEFDNLSDVTRQLLLVELAATLGTQVFECKGSMSSVSGKQVLDLMERIQDTVLAARELDPENYYPVDVLAWATKDAIATGVLDHASEGSLLAEAQASLDCFDGLDLWGQRSRWTDKQATVARLLGDDERVERYIADLAESDDPAAYYLLARQRMHADPAHGQRRALDGLLEAPAPVLRDWKCARLLLDLYWLEATGQTLMAGERQTVAMSDQSWSDCLRTLDRIDGAAGFDRYRIDFVRGLAQFHLGQYKAADGTFRTLGSRDLNVRNRVRALYLASSDTGEAQKYTGRIVRTWNDGRRGLAWVNELHTEIPIIPVKFARTHFRTENEILPDFHIAFNLLGPLADPIRSSPRRRT